MNEPKPELPGPLKSLTGAMIAGTLAVVLFALTQAIATAFATSPLKTTNVIAINIASAVRTLVLGVSALGTAIFGIAAISLILLAIQVALKPENPS